MAVDELRQIEELLAIYRRRKHELDKRIALLGASVDPSVVLERQDIVREIAKLERRLRYFAGGHAPQPDEPPETWTHSPRPDNIQAGLATAVTALAIALVLWVQPQLLGVLNAVVSGLFGCLGVLGLGIELNKMARPGVWNHFGVCAALLLLAATVYHYFSGVAEVLVLVGVALLAALYTFSLGIFNAVSRP